MFTGLSAWLLVGAGSFRDQRAADLAIELQVPLIRCDVHRMLAAPAANQDQLRWPSLCLSVEGIVLLRICPISFTPCPNRSISRSSSSHLFDNFTIREHAWAEFHVQTAVWVAFAATARLLSCTFLKQQQVSGWARHDTNGHFWSVSSIVVARDCQSGTRRCAKLRKRMQFTLP